MAKINLPTSEVWLQAKETSWPQDSEQGGRCPTALPWGAQPKGTFMFQMPNSVSVNTMCFLFHAGVELLLFSTFCTGPNVSRALREVACAESSFLNATKTRFGVKGQLFRWEEFCPNLGKAPGSLMWVGEGDPGWGVISFTFWGSSELMFQKPRQFWSSPSPKDLHGNFRADTPKKTTRCTEL